MVVSLSVSSAGSRLLRRWLSAVLPGVVAASQICCSAGGPSDPNGSGNTGPARNERASNTTPESPGVNAPGGNPLGGDLGGVDTGSSGGTPGGGTPGGGTPVALGPLCEQLLSQFAGTYSCPTSPPDVASLAEDCMRDAYIASAIVYCWAAYCYGQCGDAAKSQASSQCAEAETCQALEYCSDAPVIGPSTECSTVDIYPCGGSGLNCPGSCPTDVLSQPPAPGCS